MADPLFRNISDANERKSKLVENALLAADQLKTDIVEIGGDALSLTNQSTYLADAIRAIAEIDRQSE